MPPYKKQMTTEGQVPSLELPDNRRTFSTISQSAYNLSEATAALSKQAFISKYEVQSRKLLMQSYENNQNNPEQLLKEQQKIRVGLLQALPTAQMRDEYSARFEVQAMPYIQKAKENLYNTTFEDTQAAIMEDIDTTISSVEKNSAALYSDNPAASAATISATLMDADRIINNISIPDEKGNFYLAPAQRVAVKNNINKAITAGARYYFDSLPTVKQKMAFAKQYAEGKAKINVIDPKSESGFNKVGIENITDRQQLESNINYFKTFFTKSAEPKTNPNVYVALESEVDNGNFDQKKINYAYTQGQLSLSDKSKLEERANSLIPSAKKQAVSLINSKFSASNLDARFGDINYVREKALQSFYQKVQLDPKASDIDLIKMANDTIDEYEIIDSDNMMLALPIPKAARDEGYTKKDMSKWTAADVDNKIKAIQDKAKARGQFTQDEILSLSQYNEWYPYLENKAKKANLGVK